MTGRDELREAAQALLDVCIQDFGLDGSDKDDEAVISLGMGYESILTFGLLRRLKAALTAGQPGAGDGAVPADHKLVPVEPTAGMILAARGADPGADGDLWVIVRAAINAAPAAPAADLGAEVITDTKIRAAYKAWHQSSNMEENGWYSSMRKALEAANAIAPPDPPSTPEHECNTVRERPNRASLIQALERIAGMCPATCDLGLAHMMAEEAVAALAAERGAE